MVAVTAFLRDLFCLAHAHLAAEAAGDGRAFERRVERRLSAVGVRRVEVFSGVRSLGSQSLSGLCHQIDATCATRDAIVIGEWKTYRGAIPKNELMRFKAATDDYWLRRQHPFATPPVMRIFGGTGFVSPALRRYAGQYGICPVTTDRWPAPLLASENTAWPEDGPGRLDRRYLAWLSRPLGTVLAPLPDGSWSIPKPATDGAIDHILTLHEYWSDRLWRRFTHPGSFDQWIQVTIPCGAAA